MGRISLGALLGMVMMVALAPMPVTGADHGGHTAYDDSAAAHGQNDGHHGADPHQAQAAEHHDHAAHEQMLEASGKSSYEKKVSAYEIPGVTLVDQDGNRHVLDAFLDADKPVLLNFIFTSCTTICPVMTSTFVEVGKQLGPEVDEVQMVSITIDPEYDTPARLTEYAHARGAGSTWIFLTGDLSSIRQAQTAFDAYRGNKTNHVPITLIRAKSDQSWLRIDGLASAADIVREYRGLTTE